LLQPAPSAAAPNDSQTPIRDKLQSVPRHTLRRWVEVNKVLQKNGTRKLMRSLASEEHRIWREGGT
jgi:hypothetical protein